MLIQLAEDLPAYFYDVFVTRFDFWLVFGIAAQLVFGSRFILQWIASERAGRSVMPLSSSGKSAMPPNDGASWAKPSSVVWMAVGWCAKSSQTAISRTAPRNSIRRLTLRKLASAAIASDGDTPT